MQWILSNLLFADMYHSIWHNMHIYRNKILIWNSTPLSNIYLNTGFSYFMKCEIIIYTTFFGQHLIGFFFICITKVCLIAIFKTETLWRKLLKKKCVKLKIFAFSFSIIYSFLKIEYFEFLKFSNVPPTIARYKYSSCTLRWDLKIYLHFLSHQVHIIV